MYHLLHKYFWTKVSTDSTLTEAVNQGDWVGYELTYRYFFSSYFTRGTFFQHN